MGEIQGKSQTFRDLPVSVGVGEVLCEFHSASAKQIRFCGENKQTNKQTVYRCQPQITLSSQVNGEE